MFLSYVLISEDMAHLFGRVEKDRRSFKLKAHLLVLSLQNQTHEENQKQQQQHQMLILIHAIKLYQQTEALLCLR